MENSILYTFSTIAQALGGAFALLSAFVLFRFQSLDASMLNASIGLRSIWKTPSDLETYDTLRGLSVWPKSVNDATGIACKGCARYRPWDSGGEGGNRTLDPGVMNAVL